MVSREACGSLSESSSQTIGPKLSGYPTSITNRATVVQNATPGFLREVMAQSVSGPLPSLDVAHRHPDDKRHQENDKSHADDPVDKHPGILTGMMVFVRV